MAKWALFAAHSYVRAGAACPRTVGVDGRPLQRPWRVPSAKAVQAAKLHRRARPQPWWPRLVGAACLSCAVWFAVHPIGLHVAAMSSAPPAPRPKPLLGESAAVAGLWPPFVFRWQGGDPMTPCTWVLLDAGYEEIARREDLHQCAFATDEAICELFAAGATFHWYVLGRVGGRAVSSPLQTLSMR